MSDGKGCRCAAYGESECGCGVDWTPQEVYDLRAKVERLHGYFNRIISECFDDLTRATCIEALSGVVEPSFIKLRKFTKEEMEALDKNPAQASKGHEIPPRRGLMSDEHIENLERVVEAARKLSIMKAPIGDEEEALASALEALDKREGQE